jgi:hypothetical protein
MSMILAIVPKEIDGPAVRPYLARALESLCRTRETKKPTIVSGDYRHFDSGE